MQAPRPRLVLQSRHRALTGGLAALAAAAVVLLGPGVVHSDGGSDPEYPAASVPEMDPDLATKIWRASLAGQDQVAVEISVQEFVDLQHLTDNERQRVFGLPASCRPKMDASWTAGALDNRLVVHIVCSR